MLVGILHAVVVRAAMLCPPGSRVWALPLEALDLFSQGCIAGKDLEVLW